METIVSDTNKMKEKIMSKKQQKELFKYLNKSISTPWYSRIDFDNILMTICWITQPTNVLLVCCFIIGMIWLLKS